MSDTLSTKTRGQHLVRGRSYSPSDTKLVRGPLPGRRPDRHEGRIGQSTRGRVGVPGDETGSPVKGHRKRESEDANHHHPLAPCREEYREEPTGGSSPVDGGGRGTEVCGDGSEVEGSVLVSGTLTTGTTKEGTEVGPYRRRTTKVRT